MTASEKDNQLLVCCTFDCGSDFSFHQKMYENVFDNYYYFVLLNKGKNIINNYVIYSDRLVGKRFEKGDIRTITFVYYINVYSNTFSGYALIDNERRIPLVNISNVYLVKS